MIESTSTYMLASSKSSPLAKLPASEESGRDSGAFADVLAKSTAAPGPADEHAAQSSTADTLAHSFDTADTSENDCTAIIYDVDQALMIALLGDGVAWEPVPAALPVPESASPGSESRAHSVPDIPVAASGKPNTARNNLRRASEFAGALPDSVVTPDNAALPVALVTAVQVLSTDRNAQAVNIYNDRIGSTAATTAGFSSSVLGAPKAPVVAADGIPASADEEFQVPPQAAEATPVSNLATSAPMVSRENQGVHIPGATLLVSTHMDSPAWSKDFGQHVIRLAVEGQPAAEIHLNPPELGPIHVSIKMNGQDATLQFSAEHLRTREALESALPRLREMFSAGALTLTSAEVAGQTFSHHSSNPQGRPPDQTFIHRQGMPSRAVAEIDPISLVTARSPAVRSAVDLFA